MSVVENINAIRDRLDLTIAGLFLEAKTWRIQNRDVLGHVPKPPSQSNFYKLKDNVDQGELATLCHFFLVRSGAGQAGKDFKRAEEMAADLLLLSADDVMVKYGIMPADGRVVPVMETSTEKLDELIAAAIDGVRAAQEAVRLECEKLDRDHHRAPGLLRDASIDEHHTTVLDYYAEEAAKDCFASFGKDIDVLGEETLRDFVSWEKRFCALLDVIDGSDHVPMGHHLWASAITLYDSELVKVLGVVVALPSGKVYFARHDREHAWEWDDPPRQMPGCSLVKELTEARIAFYGQKPKNILPLLKNHAARSFLEKIQDDPQDGKSSTPSRAAAAKTFRIFNFGGTPAMVLMVNRKGKSVANRGRIADGVDAVFELYGQKPHDFVPGAFIAKKGGAFLCDTNGKEIDYAQLGRITDSALTRTKYVVAATKELAESVRKTFLVG